MRHTKLAFKYLMMIAMIISLTLIYSQYGYASLQDEMQNLFHGMVNVTPGNFHQSMGRGVVAGPSLTLRGGRMHTDLINFVPPSLSGGCSGIDIFLGSFSFINADQFVNLMQHIATAASGYAFKLALSVMCPTCDHIISTLNRDMQKLNAMAGDSCRIAQGAVNLVAKNLDTTGLSQAIEDGPLGSLAKSAGTAVDSFDGFLNKINTGSNTGKLSEAEIIAMMGNVAWKTLQKEGFMSGSFVSGGNELAEDLMSVTGTIVGTKGDDGDDTHGPNIVPWDPILKVKDILEGANPNDPTKPQKYTCLNSDCTAKNTVDYNFAGLEKYIKDILLGSDGQASGEDSFIYKLLMNTGSLTTQEKQLIRIAPYHMTRIRNMAVCAGQYGNMGSVPTYAGKAARLMALEVLQRYMKDTIAAITQAATGSGHVIDDYNFADALIPKYLAQLKDVQKEISSESNALEADIPTTLEEIYSAATKNCNLTPAHLNIPQFKSK